MSNSIIGALPTFYLRGLNYEAALNKYYNGYCSNIVLPKEKILISGSNLSFASKRDVDDIYIYRDRHNVTHYLSTTNCESFKVYIKDGTSPVIGGECEFCKCRFVHQAMGVPVRQIIKSNDNDHSQKYYIFYIDAIKLCSYECCLAYINNNVSKGHNLSNPHYTNSYTLLIRMYHIMYPDDPELIQASDPKLLTHNGGSLDISHYRSPKHHYKQTPNLICPPVKFVYEKT